MIPRNLVLILIVLWLLAVGCGFSFLLDYETTPGAVAAAPARWPESSSTAPDRELPTLVFIAHPRCPCTRASMEELARLFARCPGRLAAYVLFVKPANFPIDWEKSDLWVSASAIPGVHVRCDEGGVEARRFGAETSGHVMLFSPHGELLFRGGITASRGHGGTSPGSQAIANLVNQETTQISETPVFGCPLFDSSKTCCEGKPSCIP